MEPLYMKNAISLLVQRSQRSAYQRNATKYTLKFVQTDLVTIS